MYDCIYVTASLLCTAMALNCMHFVGNEGLSLRNAVLKEIVTFGGTKKSLPTKIEILKVPAQKRLNNSGTEENYILTENPLHT